MSSRSLETSLGPARTVLAAAAILVSLAASTAPAIALERLVLLQQIITDANAPPGRPDLFLDSTILVAWRQAYASATLGSFDAGFEAGAFRRDRRGSAYGAVLRRRAGGFVENTSLQVDTQQKLGRVVVGAGLQMFWPDHPEADNLQWVPAVGTEVYYGGWSFAGVRITHDPRPDTGTTFRFMNRTGTADAHLEIVIAPRTDGAVGYSVQGRWRTFLAGYGSEPDYDFTDVDRQGWFFGFHFDLGAP